jgi:hypothetical protein
LDYRLIERFSLNQGLDNSLLLEGDKMKRKGIILLAMVMVSVFLITSAPQAEQKFLRMFSGPEGGSWYPI